MASIITDPLAAIEQLKNRTDPHCRYNLAVALRLANRLDDCGEVAEKLWNDGYQTPHLALLFSNWNLDMGRYDSSEWWAEHAWKEIGGNFYDTGDVWHRYARNGPDFALPLACARLRRGKWDKSTWDLWELGRLGRSWDCAPGTKPWKGEPEKLVVLSEGGYGDIFLFTRFFRLLDPLQRAASRFVTGPGLKEVRSLGTEWDGMKTIFADEPFDWSSFRCSAALMSLPAGLKIRRPEEIPPADSAWENDAKHIRTTKLDSFRKEFGKTIRFGLCWTAEENGVQKRIRSIDRTEELEPLSRFRFVSLCPGKRLPFAIEANLNSWAMTIFALIQLDAVVTVDTAIAHLAGLMGIPTLVLLPLAVDWKHGVEGEKSWWWPSWTLIRNTNPYTWKPALEQAATLLEKM